MERYIAVDSGKYATTAVMQKADGSVKRLYMRTKMDMNSSLDTVKSRTTSPAGGLMLALRGQHDYSA